MNKLLTCLALALALALAMIAALNVATHQEEVAVDRVAKPPSVVLPRATNADPRFTPRMAPSSTDSHEIEIEDKYDPLLATVAPSIRERLKVALLSRDDSRADLRQVAESEREISLLLSEDSYSLYERLRESQQERMRIDQFAQHLADISPLTRQQHRDLLVAKLKHKNEMQALELQADAQTDLAPMESEYAHDVALQGIEHYTNAFLDDARSLLTEQQWIALKHFEAAAVTPRIDNVRAQAPPAL